MPLWSRQLAMFGLVGTAGFLVDAGTLLAAHKFLGLNWYAGRLVSFLVAATFTWQLNRSFTFESTARTGLLAQWLRFLAANAGGGLINLGVYAVLISSVPIVKAQPVVGVACGSLAGLVFNFLASRHFVFSASATKPSAL